MKKKIIFTFLLVSILYSCKNGDTNELSNDENVNKIHLDSIAYLNQTDTVSQIPQTASKDFISISALFSIDELLSLHKMTIEQKMSKIFSKGYSYSKSKDTTNLCFYYPNKKNATGALFINFSKHTEMFVLKGYLQLGTLIHQIEELGYEPLDDKEFSYKPINDKKKYYLKNGSLIVLESIDKEYQTLTFTEYYKVFGFPKNSDSQ
jgi:hypothetical protein